MKKLFLAVLTVISLAAVLNASTTRLWSIDSPTTNILPYGTYNIDIKFINDGGLQPKLNFGVFKIFNIGIGLELARFIGQNDSIKVGIPALSAKLQLYGGDMSWPAFALGYEGMGYYFNADLKNDYVQPGKGAYLVVGREAFYEGLMLNMGFNVNDFSDPKLYVFFNSIVPVYEETVFVLAEYDNLHSFKDARFNMGVRCALTDYLDLDFFLRDCFRGKQADRIPYERIFRITYTGKF